MESTKAHWLSRFGPAILVAVSTAWFATISIRNAANMSPCWGQDLAFFHQIVHSAANGGPWASPLLFEPQGFFAMVHTHLVLPVVVAVYHFVPRQEVLLVFHAFFASLALWPAWRLAELCGAKRMAILAPLSLFVFSPFQGAAIADFRPSVLFLPGILGVFYGAAARRPTVAIAWAIVALCGRQEAAWLVTLCACCLFVFPWPRAHFNDGFVRKWKRGRAVRSALYLFGIGLVSLVLWMLSKDQMFFHFNPAQPEVMPDLPAEHLESRSDYLLRILRSGWLFGLLSPAPLLGLVPIGYEMSTTAREWPVLVGPAAHYPAFWLPFLAASGIAGACRFPRYGLPLLVLLNALAFPRVGLRAGNIMMEPLFESIDETDRVAADYDTIHRVSGRAVLWNTVQLNLGPEERPYGWERPWPIEIQEVDVIITRKDDPLLQELTEWRIIAETDSHLTLRTTDNPTISPPSIGLPETVR